MTATLQDLDAAISELTVADTTLASAVEQNTVDVNLLLDKIANSPMAQDFQAEVDQVKASTAAAQAAIEAMKASDLKVNPPQQ